MNQTLVAIQDLHVHFAMGGGVFAKQPRSVLRAVDGVTLDIRRGETLGLVGESGCGKSTTGRAILQLERPTQGSVRFGDRELTTLRGGALRTMRRNMQMIFQNPYASLNPRMTVGSIIGEPLRVHGLLRGSKLQDRVMELLSLVGLDPAHVRRFPHEFSGGQRQRIGIARAIALNPDFIVADEPISALDVSIQAQIINLMQELQEKLDLTYLFIAHDLSAVRHISDRIAVMYLGRLVEQADARSLVAEPLHPYTQALISAIPIPDPVRERARNRVVLTGDVPSPLDPPSGCRFRTRCPWAFDRCVTEDPRLHEHRPGHFAACHLLDEPEPRHLRQNLPGLVH